MQQYKICPPSSCHHVCNATGWRKRVLSRQTDAAGTSNLQAQEQQTHVPLPFSMHVNNEQLQSFALIFEIYQRTSLERQPIGPCLLFGPLSSLLQKAYSQRIFKHAARITLTHRRMLDICMFYLDFYHLREFCCLNRSESESLRTRVLLATCITVANGPSETLSTPVGPKFNIWLDLQSIAHGFAVD
jgi:hypothetical protein